MKVSCISKAARECTNEEYQEDLHASDPCYIRVGAIEKFNIVSLIDTK